MSVVSKCIDKFIRNEISLNREDISGSVTSREWFLKRIRSEIEKRTNEPVLYASDPLVRFGSYFKRTKVTDVDEFDMLVVIDSNTGAFRSGGLEIGDGLGTADPNYKYAEKYKKSDGSGVSPTKMLNWLQNVVQTVTDSYGGSAPIKDGQAVTAYIKSANINIDLVPAGIFKRNEAGSIFYNIPRGDKNGGWIITSPRQDIELLNKVAKERQRFRDIIRLCKFVRDKYNFGVSSFAIETAVINFAQSYSWLDDLAWDLKRTLDFISRSFKNGIIPDSYEKSNNLIDGVTSLAWYAERIDKILAVLSSLDDETNEIMVYDKLSKVLKNE